VAGEAKKNMKSEPRDAGERSSFNKVDSISAQEPLENSKKCLFVSSYTIILMMASVELGLQNCSGWLQHMRAALKNDNVEQQSQLDRATSDATNSIETTVQRIMKLEKVLTMQMSVISNLERDFSLNKVAHGCLIQKSVQITRELEETKRRLRLDKDELQNTITAAGQTRSEIDILNANLRDKLQEVLC